MIGMMAGELEIYLTDQNFPHKVLVPKGSVTLSNPVLLQHHHEVDIFGIE